MIKNTRVKLFSAMDMIIKLPTQPRNLFSTEFEKLSYHYTAWMTVPDRSGICAQVDTQTSAVGEAKRNEASIINPDLIRYILNCFELMRIFW